MVLYYLNILERYEAKCHKLMQFDDNQLSGDNEHKVRRGKYQSFYQVICDIQRRETGKIERHPQNLEVSVK